MKTTISSIFCPVIASEARKMVNDGLFKMISVADFPRGAPLYDSHKRLAYFAIAGTAAAFDSLDVRVAARVKAADNAEARQALIGAMMPIH